MSYFRFRFVCLLFLLFCFVLNVFTQGRVDSLLNELSQSQSKAEIYNLLAEATIEDSIELSSVYANQALETARTEENENQLGLAWFNIAEVFSYQYQRDSAIPYYNLALVT